MANGSNEQENRKSDVDLIEEIKLNGQEESLKEIISRHESLCYKIYLKYKRQLYLYGYTQTEFESDKTTIIIDAILSYDVTKKVKFITWLGNNVLYFLLKKLRDKDRYITNYNFDYPTYNLSKELEVDNFYSEDYNKMLLINDVLAVINNLDDKRIKRIFELRFFEIENPKKKKTGWIQIAEEMNLSHPTVISLYKKGIEILREKIKL